MSARVVRRAALYAVAAVLVAIFMGPFLWSLGSSLKTAREMTFYPPTLLPAAPRFQNYADVFGNPKVPMALFALNSIQVALLSVVGQVLSATVVAYGFSRFRFPYRNVLFVLLLSTLVMPREVLLIPNFLLFRYLGLFNTLTPLWLPSFFGGAFNVFLLRQFLMTLPPDLDEAAKIDGASNWRIWWNILMPLSYPVLVAIGIFSFVNHWNDVIDPLLFLSQEGLKTLSLGLRAFISPNDASYHITMAASMWLVVPMMLVFFVGQRYFIRGVAMSGITGR